ncbi:MAG: lamin tail domain-containing protein [Solirubrobacteraceae bacterium]
MTLTLTTLRATIAAALLFAALTATAGAATRGPCVVGQARPTCWVWSGHAVGAPDGDTPNIAIEGSAPRHVRITGIQAMEGRECHGPSTTARLNRLIDAAHGRVRLAARSASSSSMGRPRRSVSGLIGGRWVDFGRVLLREGYVLWDPNPVEDAWNRGYSALAQRAAARGRGLWNPRACGIGPKQSVKLRLFVQWDADGDDTVNRNGEYVRVEHRGSGGPVSLYGWWIRDSALRRYTFPRSAVLRRGQSVTLHMGGGRHTGSSFYWGQPSSVFEAVDNPRSPAVGMGDGAYLFDPQGDLRAAFQYPCRRRCRNPARTRVRLTVHNEHADEYVLIRNVSSRPVDLDGQVAKTSMQRSFDFGARGVLSMLWPGETLRLDTGGDPADDSRLHRHWGLSPPVLDDRSGAVALRTLTDLLTACQRWGSAACPGG